MIWLRTVLIIGIIVFFQRLVVEKNSYNVTKVISFMFVTMIAIALIFLEKQTLELYYPFFIVMVLLGGKTLESINMSKKKDER